MSIRQQIRDMIESGLSNIEIAEIIGRTRSYVAAARCQLNIPSESGRRSNFQGNSVWSADADRYMKHAVSRGMSRREVAEKLGTTKNAVIGRMHRLRQKESAPAGS